MPEVRITPYLRWGLLPISRRLAGMRTYLPRTVDDELARALRTSGAVVIKGPRACGKTETARRAAASEIGLDQDTAAVALSAADPRLLLDGATPRLLDEWQAVPGVWNAVRHAVDDRGARGQFILTGSATPEEDARRHSGAGRMRNLTMRTMTLSECGAPAAPASLGALLDGALEPSSGTAATVADYVSWMVRGGWPGRLDLEADDAAEAVASYVDEMSEHDYPLVGGPRRDPRRFRAFLAAYAGLVAQPASLAAVRRRMGEITGRRPADSLVSELHDFAARLFLVEDQPAWAARLRSRTPLIQTPKRHLADPSPGARAPGRRRLPPAQRPPDPRNRPGVPGGPRPARRRPGRPHARRVPPARRQGARRDRRRRRGARRALGGLRGQALPPGRRRRRGRFP